MKAKLFFILSLFLFSCEPEVIEPTPPTCDCREYHEQLTSGGFPITTYWEYDYETIPQPDLCEKETGAWIYSSNNTHRYKVICD